MKRFVMFKIGNFTGRGVLESPSIAVRNWYLNNSNFSVKYMLTTNVPSTDLHGFSSADEFITNPTITITMGAEIKKLRVLNTKEHGNNRLIMEVGV